MNATTDLLLYDFLCNRLVFKYLIIISFVLLGGAFLDDFAALSVVFIILFFAFTGNLYRALEWWLVWFFIYNFYLGQGYFNNEIVASYIVKPPFILFVIFLLFNKGIPHSLKRKNFVFIWIAYIVVSAFSLIYHFQRPFTLITESSFIMIYLILGSKCITLYQYKRLLNLIIAVALIQTVVSFLQVSELISPPSVTTLEGNYSYNWIAGLDDASSGTFGGGLGYSVSWFQSLGTIFLVLFWVITKRNSYLYFVPFLVIQYAMGDSKTIVGVTILMVIYLLFLINSKSNILQLQKKILVLIFIFMVFGFGVYKGWDYYYRENYQLYKDTGVSGSYEYVNLSADVVISNIWEWGKIQGFVSVSNDFLDQKNVDLLFGYGLLGYTYSKMAFIESKDTRIMQFNNITNSRSGLITIYATTGLIGGGLFFLFFYFWYKFNINFGISNKMDFVILFLLKSFLFFSLLEAFLYSNTINSIPTITFGALIAILNGYNKKIKLD